MVVLLQTDSILLLLLLLKMLIVVSHDYYRCGLTFALLITYWLFLVAAAACLFASGTSAEEVRLSQMLLYAHHYQLKSTDGAVFWEYLKKKTKLNTHFNVFLLLLLIWLSTGRSEVTLCYSAAAV